ncbi:MAG: molybdenum cofactor biosynthesis protein MoaE [Intrasporangium sp.]|uniref:molybdenum cofactor biosynthesis protein MoaE n=1 Tax=Intrasporangium sp. TaxID=1925024 RepID=UPI002648413B|nr:molybdenum cofactor biosynthesis protein MoaE [Intrasporangium sp.]MDN5796729.1 molybdenum cofactor biosynthesis protein MoaE [Intrasporangium sp.]
MTSVTVTLAEIRETPLSVDEVFRSVSDPRAGGICLFVGTVRDADHGKGVERLDYSAHPQAGDRTRQLAERLDGQGRTVRIGVLHRVGALAIGDLAVVVGVSAEHRAEAFQVCQALIDELKSTLPIWKHQRFTDGVDEWVGLP